MDQRTGKEHGDHGSQTHLSSEDKSHSHADHVAADAAVLELDWGPLGQAEGDGVIDRYAHVCREVQRSAQAHNGNADQEHKETEEKSSIGKQGGKEPGEKFCNIAQEEHIDHSSQADLLPVRDQCENEKKKTEYSIKSSIAHRRQVPESVGQDLKRIHTKGGIVEKSHSHAAGGNSSHRHSYAPCFF